MTPLLLLVTAYEYLNVSRRVRLRAWRGCPIFGWLREVFGHKPGEAGPALEVDNVVLAFFLGKSLSSGLTGQCHCDVQTAQQESYLLTTRVLQYKASSK